MSVLSVPPILEATPRLLREITACFDDDTLQWKPAPERWSCAQVLAHLAESEVTCFRTRLLRAAREDCPVLEPYDQHKHAGSGERFSPAEELARFERERSATLALLRALPATVLDRRCVHREFGPMTFANLLNEFAFHDIGHTRQILELCRARSYYPHMGAWQKYYQVAP